MSEPVTTVRLLPPFYEPSRERENANTRWKSDRATAIEALRRSQYKFPGRQKIIVSKNWGFTPLRRDEYLEKRKAGMVKIDGAYVQFLRNKGPIERNVGLFPEAFETEA